MTDSTADNAVRLGVFGGTFDPVHLGHLASARDCAKQFSLDHVYLVLSARPPHKGGAARASAEHRMAMLQAATAGQDLLVASDLELRRKGPSYTVDSLADLGAAHPGAELFLILGADAYAEIDTWHRPEALLEAAHIVVTTRPGFPPTGGPPLPPIAARNRCCYDSGIDGYVHESGHRLMAHAIDGLDVSATEIRSRAARGLDIGRLVGEAVATYIRKHGLYKADKY